jgi:hypothetical protein
MPSPSETRVRLDAMTRARLQYGWQRLNAERAQRFEPLLTLSQYLALVLGPHLPVPGPNVGIGGE